MGTIRNLANRFRALDFELIKQESLRETVTEVPELNREQLRKGQLSDGNLIRPQLDNPVYAVSKQTKGGIAPFMTPDLLNTGAFQEQITTTITAKTIKTFSLDLKAPKLELKYTPLIYGLDTPNMGKYAQSVRPVLFEKLRAATVG